MYEPISHSQLNNILENIKPQTATPELRYFFTRLGANFYAIYSLYQKLYGNRGDIEEKLVRLVNVLAARYIARSADLKRLDLERENNHNWFLSQEWVALALYVGGFSKDLKNFEKRLSYLNELGVNMIHLMPMMTCPEGASDGGYAVSNFKEINPNIGNLEDLGSLVASMRHHEMLLVLDVVVNHTSDEHEWAQRAKRGEQTYQNYFFSFSDRTVPDLFERSMPEIFPETSPGNFTWSEEMGKWVMTVFNDYQWDLNYTNPDVLIEMIDIILFWANQGADVIRLDAVAFLWKRIGTDCQNQQEAHLILQLLKDCCQVTAPGVLFIAEAIVAPFEIIKYFGEDAIVAKECEIAYNATFMALMWDAVATKNAKLIAQGIKAFPGKLDRATWLNYVRCHDDIGLGFNDDDIRAVGYDPQSHRRFLLDFFSGDYPTSNARGHLFGKNRKTGDARISGSLASLVGLEAAIEKGDKTAIEQSIQLILLLHGLILSFGGLPLLYYGDEIGTINDFSFLTDANKAHDNRWIHRPIIDWEKAERRHTPGTIEQRIFSGLKKMIALRKTINAFADFNNREIIQTSNDHILAFVRTHHPFNNEMVFVAANFNDQPQKVGLHEFSGRGAFLYGQVTNLLSGHAPEVQDGFLVIPAYCCYWLTDQKPGP